MAHVPARLTGPEASTAPEEIDRYLKRLFPLARSLSGNANRETLRILQEIVPLAVGEIASGTRVYDWVVPDEWNLRHAWISAQGRKIVDSADTNLHVVSYSEPISTTLSWNDLEPHLHVHESLPDAVPYRTSYYHRSWGFCVTGTQKEELREAGGLYEVRIDAELGPGSLTFADCLIPGASSREILLSCYICHPSMANDSLSGVLLTAFLARSLSNRPNRLYSYRIVFVPETIGAIAYCALNEQSLRAVDLGLVITTVGGPGKFGYKQTWDSDHPLNRIIEEVFAERQLDYVTYPFDIHGSDERQFSSPGFRINVASITKDKYYEYPEYHSSLDNLSLVTGRQIHETLQVYEDVIHHLDRRRVYRRTNPHGEAMMSRHGLYPTTGGAQRPVSGSASEVDAMLWWLFLCDGRLSVEDIGKRLEFEPGRSEQIAKRLEESRLIVHV